MTGSGPDSGSGGDGERAVRAAFATQAMWCDRLCSPFTAHLMRVLERTLDRQTRTGRAVLDWQGHAGAAGDAVPLRLAGGLNALARGGTRQALTAAWPGRASETSSRAVPNDDEAFERLVAATLVENDDTLLDWLERPPQTNEVGRSAAVWAGLMHVAARTALPLSLHELGASAGLNLIPDRYGYRLGGRVSGALDGGLVLEPTWNGAAPDGVEPTVLSRRGCDRSPIDVTDAVARERLLAYVWPDQPERLERLESALALALDDPPLVERADAADWIEERLPPIGQPRETRVLFHTIARQYFPTEVEVRVAARIADCAAKATEIAPFAHLSYEQDGERGPALDVTLWPGGQRSRLAHGHAHGSTMDWYGP